MSVVRNGYVMCGQDAPIGLNHNNTPTDKFYTQVRFCKAKISTEHMDILVKQLPQMARAHFGH
jgi:hypothetical protein